MDDEFMKSWKLTREGTTVTEVLRVYYAQGFPKVPIPVKELYDQFKKYGWSVDPKTAVVSSLPKTP
jgi:hypothetical protein